MTETPDIFVEIARWARACWMRIRRYLRELNDQPKVALSLKTRMVKTGAIEALLYGCSTWTLRQKQYSKEGFNDWGGRGYDDFVPGKVTKTAPSGDRTTGSPTWSASLPRIHHI